MVTATLDGHLARPVEIDHCPGCQLFWFDHQETLQLTPRATLALFRTIGEQVSGQRQAIGPVTRCPRCSSQLLVTHDRQRNVAFQYRRCPHGHGRLTTYFDFLREKNFIRPLSAEQVEELRRNVASVNCSNCGAPVDVQHSSTCAHCSSPITILDLRQAGELVAQLQRATSLDGQVDPALPMRLEQARREVEAAFAAAQRQPGRVGPSADTDLVGAGLMLLARWLKP